MLRNIRKQRVRIYKKVKEVKAQLRVLRTLYYFFGGTACLGNLLISCKGDLCSL